MKLSINNEIDRRNVSWDPDNPLDPAAFRHQYQPGDFELEKLQLEDVLVTVHNPGDFRPYTASIFRADIGTESIVHSTSCPPIVPYVA